MASELLPDISPVLLDMSLERCLTPYHTIVNSESVDLVAIKDISVSVLESTKFGPTIITGFQRQKALTCAKELVRMWPGQCVCWC